MKIYMEDNYGTLSHRLGNGAAHRTLLEARIRAHHNRAA